MAHGAAVVRGEVWWADTPAGDRPVLVLTRDPVADHLDAVVVAMCTRRVRGLTSELPLDAEDGMPHACVASFDNLFTLRKERLRERITALPSRRERDLCRVLGDALGCPGLSSSS